MSTVNRITIDPTVCGGRPCIRGLRIRVKDVLDLLAAGAAREEILADYPCLEADDIAAVRSLPPVRTITPSCGARRCTFWSTRSCLRALARRLEALGHVAEHVTDRGLVSASDDVIRDYAAGVGAIIVTKDEDFAVRRLLTGGPADVWLPLGNTRSAALLARVEADLPAIVAALERGEMLVEVV